MSAELQLKGYEITDLGALLTIEHEEALRDEEDVYDAVYIEQYNVNDTFAINSSGQVTGVYSLSGQKGFHAYRTTPTGTFYDGTATDFGILGGQVSHGRAINDKGQITGISELRDGKFHAFRAGESMIDLGSYRDRWLVRKRDYSSLGRGINNAGQVVGQCFGSGIQRGFRTMPNCNIGDKGTDLGTLGGTFTDAYGINDSGQVTGSSFLKGDKVSHAFRTTPTGKLSNQNDTDLGTLGWLYSVGNAINVNGQITGCSWTGKRLESGDEILCAFRTTGTGNLIDGTCINLGTLGGSISGGLDINSKGYVVGYSTIRTHKGPYAIDRGCHAFLYTDQMIDLNSMIPENSGWTLLYAQSINDQEQISGIGMLEGQKHAFRMTPTITYEKRQQILALREILEVRIHSL